MKIKKFCHKRSCKECLFYDDDICKCNLRDSTPFSWDTEKFKELKNETNN